MKAIFHGEGRLTEDAVEACKTLGIDPQELANKPLDVFRRKGGNEQAAQRLWSVNKKKR